jgi:hypothetical protein
VADREKVEDDAQGDAEVEKEGDEPAVVVAVEDEAGDPPSARSLGYNARKQSEEGLTL